MHRNRRWAFRDEDRLARSLRALHTTVNIQIISSNRNRRRYCTQAALRTPRVDGTGKQRNPKRTERREEKRRERNSSLCVGAHATGAGPCRLLGWLPG